MKPHAKAVAAAKGSVEAVLAAFDASPLTLKGKTTAELHDIIRPLLEETQDRFWDLPDDNTLRERRREREWGEMRSEAAKRPAATRAANKAKREAAS
jgi:hypothetical protein